MLLNIDRLFMLKDTQKTVRNTRWIVGRGSEHPNVDNGGELLNQAERSDSYE